MVPKDSCSLDKPYTRAVYFERSNKVRNKCPGFMATAAGARPPLWFVTGLFCGRGSGSNAKTATPHTTPSATAAGATPQLQRTNPWQRAPPSAPRPCMHRTRWLPSDAPGRASPWKFPATPSLPCRLDPLPQGTLQPAKYRGSHAKV